jgi:DnaJ-class molecular chaperone
MRGHTALCPECKGPGYTTCVIAHAVYRDCCGTCHGRGHVSVHHVCWWHRIGAAWRQAKRVVSRQTTEKG